MGPPALVIQESQRSGTWASSFWTREVLFDLLLNQKWNGLPLGG